MYTILKFNFAAAKIWVPPPGGTLKIFEGVLHFLDFNDNLL